MKKSCYVILLVLLIIPAMHKAAVAASELKLNLSLDYNSDSDDGPLITGKDMSDGDADHSMPAYIIIYQRECYNSKRQARRTVELYDKYRGRVKFIVIDLDSSMSYKQKKLVNRFYNGYIPNVTVLGNEGNVLYNSSGEVSKEKISRIFERELM